MKHWAIMILAGGLSVGCSAHYHTIRNSQADIYLKASGAQSVFLVVAGDSFEKVPAVRTRLGTWKVTLDLANEFKYFYLVDGEVYLPECPLRERDDFGAENCVFSP